MIILKGLIVYNEWNVCLLGTTGCLLWYGWYVFLCQAAMSGAFCAGAAGTLCSIGVSELSLNGSMCKAYDLLKVHRK